MKCYVYYVFIICKRFLNIFVYILKLVFKLSIYMIRRWEIFLCFVLDINCVFIYRRKEDFVDFVVEYFGKKMIFLF